MLLDRNVASFGAAITVSICKNIKTMDYTDILSSRFSIIDIDILIMSTVTPQLKCCRSQIRDSHYFIHKFWCN